MVFHGFEQMIIERIPLNIVGLAKITEFTEAEDDICEVALTNKFMTMI